MAGLAAVAVVLCTALVSCGTQVGVPADRPSASISPDASGTEGHTVEHDIAVEERLDQVADDIEQGREGPDIPGYAGLEIDVPTSTVKVYWVGEPPQHVRQVAATPPTGVTVSLYAARYDLKAMTVAIEKVVAEYGTYLVGGAPTTDGTGITVEWTAANARKGPSTEILSAAAGMPVTTEIGEPAEPAEAVG